MNTQLNIKTKNLAMNQNEFRNYSLGAIHQIKTACFLIMVAAGKLPLESMPFVADPNYLQYLTTGDKNEKAWKVLQGLKFCFPQWIGDANTILSLIKQSPGLVAKRDLPKLKSLEEEFSRLSNSIACLDPTTVPNDSKISIEDVEALRKFREEALDKSLEFKFLIVELKKQVKNMKGQNILT